MWPLLRLPSSYKLIKPFSTTTENDFKTVYKFPYVRGVGVINRLKLYQTVLTSMAIPSATVLSQFGVLSANDVLFTGLVGLAGIIPLYGFGHFANKLIGFVYINEKSNSAKFAYLNFWGSRRETTVPITEIVPFSESQPSFTDPLYLKIRQFSSKDTLKLCTKYGVLDDNGFNKIFNS